MVRKIWVQFLVGPYQRIKKWYLIPPCLTLSKIRYVSRVKWSNSGKGVAPSPTPQCSSYLKGSLLVALDYGRQLYFTYIYIYIYIYISHVKGKRFPWLSLSFSLALPFNHSSSLASLLGDILCPHRADVSQPLLVGHYRCVHVQNSMREDH